MPPIVLAAVAHPDDIEFLMSGTLFHLKEAGAEIHYLSIANGCFGSISHTPGEITAIRGEEARQAAQYLGAVHHPPLVNDMEVVYDLAVVRRLASLIRDVQPDIVLVHSTNDYMEDHMNSARMMATAAFTRSMPGYAVDPPREPYQKDIAIYHALPVGLCGALREPVVPHFHVDVTAVADKKKTMLEFHRSQVEWLDASQGLNSFVGSLVEQDEAVGRSSGVFRMAEGWRRHNHRGYSGPDFDPLVAALPARLVHSVPSAP